MGQPTSDGSGCVLSVVGWRLCTASRRWCLSIYVSGSRSSERHRCRMRTDLSLCFLRGSKLISCSLRRYSERAFTLAILDAYITVRHWQKESEENSGAKLREESYLPLRWKLDPECRAICCWHVQHEKIIHRIFDWFTVAGELETHCDLRAITLVRKRGGNIDFKPNCFRASSLNNTPRKP